MDNLFSSSSFLDSLKNPSQAIKSALDSRITDTFF